MSSAARRITLKVPTVFTSMVRSNEATSCTPFDDSSRIAGAMPAQFTTRRSGDAMVARAAETWPSSVTSAAAKVTPSGAVAFSSEAGRSRPRTVTPRAPRAAAVAAPNPDAAPVTRAVESDKSMSSPH
jgi:hypothetical protein